MENTFWLVFKGFWPLQVTNYCDLFITFTPLEDRFHLFTRRWSLFIDISISFRTSLDLYTSQYIRFCQLSGLVLHLVSVQCLNPPSSCWRKYLLNSNFLSWSVFVNENWCVWKVIEITHSYFLAYTECKKTA